MSKFSEYLEKGIMNSGLTESQLAKISGFTRSYIALMKNGLRVSPDMTKMKALLQALNLSVEEYKTIWSEYVQIRMGKEQYKKTEVIMKFMENFDIVSKLNVKAVVQYDIPDKLVLKGHLDIEYMIRALIETEAMKEDGFVYILMQPEDSLWKSYLPGICKNYEHLSIDHIICMEKYTDAVIDDSNLYNVELLKRIVPTVVCSTTDKYKVYCFYDHIATRGNTGWLLSNMVLTSDHLICFDATMNNGVLTNDPAMYVMYKKMFEEHRKNCNQMFEQMNFQQSIQYGTDLKKMRNRTSYTIATQPCFAMLKLSHIVKRYIKPEYEFLGNMLELQISENVEWISREKNKEVAYCNKNGLLRLAEEGIVDEMPYGTYEPVNKIDRKKILQLLVEQIENGKYEVYIIDDEYVKLLPELTIVSFSESCTVVRYQSPQHYSDVMLQEKSSGKIIYDALGAMMKNPHVLGFEESMEYIKKLMTSLE